MVRKWYLQNNPPTLRIQFRIDVVFYIFKVFHNHALLRFRLSLGADAPVLSTLLGKMKANNNTHQSYGRSLYPSSVQASDSTEVFAYNRLES